MCSERSGSNLITKIFDSHPKVSGPSTSHIADVILPNIHKYGNLRGSYWTQLIIDILYLLETKNAIWISEFTELELQSNIKEGNVAELFSYIYCKEARENNKEIVFIKENRIYEISQFLVEHYPNVDYLYMVRDPRDMAASWKNSHAIRGGVVRASRVWLRDQIGFLRMRAWLKNNDRIPFFKYEKLLTCPKSTLRKVCALLNINYHDEMLDFHLKQETIDNSQAAADWRNIALPIMTDNIGKFESQLSEDELLYVESVCYQYMQSLGYKRKNLKVLHEHDLQALEDKLLSLEQGEKENYKLVSLKEKQRREKHYQYSVDIRQQNFTISGLLNE